MSDEIYDKIDSLNDDQIEKALINAVELMWKERWKGTGCSENKEDEKWEILSEILED